MVGLLVDSVTNFIADSYVIHKQDCAHSLANPWLKAKQSPHIISVDLEMLLGMTR